MSASTWTAGAHRELFACLRRDLTGDHRDVRDTGVGGPLDHATDGLAVEARDVELAFAGDDELDVVERILEPGRVGDHVEARLQVGTDRREPAGKPTGGAGARELAYVDDRCALRTRRPGARAGA